MIKKIREAYKEFCLHERGYTPNECFLNYQDFGEFCHDLEAVVSYKIEEPITFMGMRMWVSARPGILLVRTLEHKTHVSCNR